jgi:hypothetical protein
VGPKYLSEAKSPPSKKNMAAHQRQDETKQPPPPPSTETTTTLTTTPNAYLSTHLIIPYFITANGEIKRPEHLIAWWTRIFSFYVPDEKDRKKLRFLCRLFRDSLKPPPLYTTFPHPNYPTLNELMNALNNFHQKDPTKVPTFVFIMKGTFRIPLTQDEDGFCQNDVTISYPMMILGAGQDKTIIHGGFKIQGKSKEGKKVVLQDMSMMDSIDSGLVGDNGLSFLCERMTFTQCSCGVSANNAKGRLINCVITQCDLSGIFSGRNALIELEGSQTKVEGNCTSTSGNSYRYGLDALNTSSRIHLLYPLMKESVSTNNGGGRNYGSYYGTGTIQTVNSFTATTLQQQTDMPKTN